MKTTHRRVTRHYFDDARPALHIFKVAEETNSIDSLLGVVCDNTVVNTGHNNGAVACLEKMKVRKIHK